MSRSFAIAAAELYNTPTIPSADTSANTSVYNAELMIQLSPEMQKKIQQYGSPIYENGKRHRRAEALVQH